MLFSSSGLARFLFFVWRGSVRLGGGYFFPLRLAWLGCVLRLAWRGEAWRGQKAFSLRLVWLGWAWFVFFSRRLARLGLGFRVLLVRVCRNLFSFGGIAVCGPTAKQRPRCSGHDRGSAS